MASGYMAYRGYEHIEHQREMLNAFNWDLVMISRPKGVYYPGDQIFYSRLKQVSGLPQYSHSIAEVDGPAGFKILQTGDIEHGDLSLSLTFIDYEDSTIFYLFKDWMDKTQNPETKLSMPKEYLICDIDLYQLNSQRKPVLKWIMRTGMLTSLSGYNSDFADKKQVQENITVEIRFSWWDMKFLNAQLAGG